MKKNYILILSTLFIHQFHSQDQNIEKKGLITKEMKSFAKKMITYNINPNTQNYDLQYQKNGGEPRPGSLPYFRIGNFSF
ncbi:hypothetical protein ODZ84_21345 [Chryseobacterium fluminis]|uniref:hypothetical protein n=1 Tax=Chryseobacterium fluminis TaxID=2983606 RepID=UPI00225313B0|nr:hypothetical protein [Chryseobacterium sp. MMS21-Ot14]UZT97687.1 hypothetical protein ODZ84_21345 [Chryseobacterium sp. MMS21-Ot14]